MTLAVDVHNHWYPREYIKILAKEGGSSGWELRRDDSGMDIILSKRGYVFKCLPPTYDEDYRVSEMDEGGVATQVMSISEPWVDFVPPPRSIELARLVNDDIARACERHPDRLAGMATLPLNDIEGSIEEAERAVKDLGMNGVILPTRIAGEDPLYSPRYLPVFERIERLGVTVFIHPSLPPGSEELKDNLIGLMVSYPSETTLILSQLIFSGLFDKYPSLKVLIADLGGTIPFVYGRMQRFYESFQACRKNIKHEVLYYLRKNIYYENGAAAHPDSMSFLYRLVGPNNIMMGSNHPSPIGHFTKAIESIVEMEVPDHDKEMMLHKNARRVFNLR